MILKRFYDEPRAQASLLLGDPATHEAIVVDPNRDVDAYRKAAAAEKLTIVAVTETHIHADYLSGTRELAQRAGATAYLSDEGDAEWKYAWATEPNVRLVYDVNRAVALTGAYGGSKYRKSPGSAMSRTTSNEPTTSRTPSAPSASDTRRKRSRSTMLGFS